MVVSNDAARLIIRECCAGLTFSRQTHKFTFTLKPGCDSLWKTLQPRLKSMCGIFTLDDFNSQLNEIITLHHSSSRLSLNSAIHISFVNIGETLELCSENKVIQLTKMSGNQFLSKDGGGFTFPSATYLGAGIPVVSSEGNIISEPDKVNILTPLPIHILISAIFLPKYYKKKVTGSLWTLYALSEKIRESKGDCSPLLQMAADMGLGIMETLRVINSF